MKEALDKTMGSNSKVKKNKLMIVIAIIEVMLMISGCKSLNNTDSQTDLAAPEPVTSEATIETTTTPALSVEELSMEAYRKFLKNEMKVSFVRFTSKDDAGNAFYKKGSEYTLSEALSLVAADYFSHTANKKIRFIDYSYIDCGKDGVNELVLRLNGMDIYSEDDDSTLVYVIKYTEGKLVPCYYYETWARSNSELNQYGYLKSEGSGGASSHGYNYGLIDKAGNWQFIVSIQSELDINQLTWSDLLGQIPIIAETKGITDHIELDTIRFDNDSDDAGNEECIYTFYVYDDNMTPINDANLYTNSIYKAVFDEAKVPFITPEDLSAMILVKEKSVGAAADIKNGAEITWEVLSGNMFSDYVGRY
jgi:hypothetical protein